MSAQRPGRQPEYLESNAPLAFAHRGYSPPGSHGENTLLAFRAAVELGFRYIETDLRTSADGVPMVFHDETLERITDGRGKISEYTAERLKHTLVGGSEPIPTFEELITDLPQARINFDVKDSAGVEPIAALIEGYELHDRVLVASFSDGRRRALLRRLSKPVATSGGWESILLFVLGSAWLPRKWMRKLIADVDCLQVPEKFGIVPVVTRHSIHRAHLLGLKIHVWTINDKATMHRLFDLGVDGVMTDRADLLAEVMHERDYWVADPLED